MCIRKHWERYNTSPSFHAAKKLSLELEEFAKTQGYKRDIIIKKKESIIREGFGKADAQIIWQSGPEDWTLAVYLPDQPVDCVAENGYTLSFYDK